MILPSPKKLQITADSDHNWLFLVDIANPQGSKPCGFFVLNFSFKLIRKYRTKLALPKMQKLVKTNLEGIKNLMKAHQVQQAYLFGSAVDGTMNSRSDVDFVVKFSSIVNENYAENYFNLLYALQNLLKRDIELIEESTLSNPYFWKVLTNRRKGCYEPPCQKTLF
ncbi:nucleotidyltransferase family protein [Pelobium manganitolerans]|nr:nucleotidyltransferase domain-containing protein [Pelobium manganitolerans]